VTSFPRPSDAPCDGLEFFIGASAWIGATLGPISGGFAGVAGLHVAKGDNGLDPSYVEQGGLYGSLSGKRGIGLKGGGAVNLFDGGIAW